MYKKFIVALVAILTLGAADAYAQSANRNGFYLDLTAGSNLGYIYKDHNYDYDGFERRFYAKDGVEGAIGVGYRLKLSRHWAWDFRLNLQENFFITDYFQIGILPIGIRYTSSDFGNSDKSLFCSFNTGYDMTVHNGIGSYLPFEASFGFNLTRKLYVALVGQYRLYLIWGEFDIDTHTTADPRSNGFIGARVGYRF